MQGGSDQTFNTPTTRALGNSHWCQTCNSSQGGTIKIEARTEHLSVVLRLHNRTLVDQGGPSRWHTFVSNRVSQIQSMLPTTEFLHVPSAENPADLCSRGLLATQLVAQQKFSFQGLTWLAFPDQPQTLLTNEEARQEVKTLTVLTSPSNSLVDLDNFNSLVKLLRTLCICKVAFKKDLKTKFGREETALALYAVVKADQMVHFEAEFITSPGNSLVDLDNFNSLVKLLRTLCICKVAFKKDLKTIFGWEEMALALYAVVKADQMVHFEAEFKALSKG